MTNKLVVIINSLKVPKIKKILLWNGISCTKLQLPPEPLTRGGYHPQIPILSVLCPQLNFLNPHPPLQLHYTGRHPHSYAVLLLSICGFISYFVCLTNNILDLHIARLHPHSPYHFFGNLQHESQKCYGPPTTVTCLLLLRKQTNTGTSTAVIAKTH